MSPKDVTEDLMSQAGELRSIQLSARCVCDLELLATGAFSPLDRFMGRSDYERVVEEMRLASGHVFPIPVSLPVDREFDLRLGQDIALRDSGNNLLAVMTIEEMYEWNHYETARSVFGTADLGHPLVSEMQSWGKINVSGPLRVLQLPPHYDFRELRLTPFQSREKLANLECDNIVAFQTRNPLHRAHEELINRAIDQVNGVVLLHPVVGLTNPGDVDNYTRVLSYRLMLDYFDPRRVLLLLLPLAMRMAGPREALWHAVIRRNYGANHLIVGRDHGSPGADLRGRPFYAPYEAQEMVERFSAEVGVQVIPFREFVYLPLENRYEEASRVSSETKTLSLSGTQVREDYLNHGKLLPSWFTRPEIAEVMLETYQPRRRQGVCVWFTGLSGAGKSTTAEALTLLLLEHGRRGTLLDGDVVRTHLSKGLGFSKEDRDSNIRRIGFVAAEIVRHGGMVVCATVSPYRAVRHDVRNMVGTEKFLEVFMDTPLKVCEARDQKGIYARARRGEIKLSGLSDPYEPPLNPEILLDDISQTAEENARLILIRLVKMGFVRQPHINSQDNSCFSR